MRKEIGETIREVFGRPAVLFDTVYRWLKGFSTKILYTHYNQISGISIEETDMVHLEKKISKF